MGNKKMLTKDDTKTPEKDYSHSGENRNKTKNEKQQKKIAC